MIKPLIRINAIFWIALGIAFTLYAPNLLNLFGLPDGLPEADALWFWNVVAFCRMFGAGMLSLGLLLLSLQGVLTSPTSRAEIQRGILFALVLGNLINAIVALTQQASIWIGWAGWLLCAIFAVFALLYGYALTTLRAQASSLPGAELPD